MFLASESRFDSACTIQTCPDIKMSQNHPCTWMYPKNSRRSEIALCLHMSRPITYPGCLTIMMSTAAAACELTWPRSHAAFQLTSYPAFQTTADPELDRLTPVCVPCPMCLYPLKPSTLTPATCRTDCTLTSQKCLCKIRLPVSLKRTRCH